MTGPVLLTAGEAEQAVEYLYRPVEYTTGNLNVISPTSLPLSGVQFSSLMAGAGEFRASLQLADPSVRAMYPWDKVIPRRTGIVVIRRARDAFTGVWSSQVVEHYVVWAAPRDPQSGRMMITGYTIESLWARRVITKGVSWNGVDQIQIANDLLSPGLWSVFNVIGGGTPGWIFTDPSPEFSGVSRTFSYEDQQQTNLLEAMVNRSRVPNGYEWRTAVRALDSADAASATQFRVQLVTGYPRLGRELGEEVPLARLRFDRDGGGNVLSFGLAYDGSEVPNVVWGRGNGYEEGQTRALAENRDASGSPEWDRGYLLTEGLFSDPDIKLESTLRERCFQFMWERLGSEQYVAELTVRGDRPPYFDSYAVGDDMLLETNDPTWPPEFYGSGGFVQLQVRMFGRVVTPPQESTAETVKMIVSGDTQ